MGRFSRIPTFMLPLLTLACGRDPAVRETEGSNVIQTGVASFYGREFAGRETANGETLALNEMTAASRTLPMGTRVQVTNVETGRSASVRINDRGPYAKGRVLDLTPRAARHIGIDEDQGVARVKIAAERRAAVGTAPDR